LAAERDINPPRNRNKKRIGYESERCWKGNDIVGSRKEKKEPTIHHFLIPTISHD
jgi:hypothetical protein